MTNRINNNPSIKKPATPKRSSGKLGESMRTHKALTVIAIIVLVLAAWIGVYKYSDYQQQFSLEEYNSISALARNTITIAGGGEILEKRTCDYSSIGVYDQPRLFCGIRMISYVPYQSDQQAKELGKRFDKAIAQTFLEHEDDLSNFYIKPDANAATKIVILQKPYPQEHCNFEIASKRMAQAIYDFDRRTEDNLIALSFECSGTSRGEYFPVTDR